MRKITLLSVLFGGSLLLSGCGCLGNCYANTASCGSCKPVVAQSSCCGGCTTCGYGYGDWY